LDLYLNKRLTDFEGRLKKEVLQTGGGPEAEKITAGHLVREAYNRVYRRFRRKGIGRG
jgi:phage-related protein